MIKKNIKKPVGYCPERTPDMIERRDFLKKAVAGMSMAAVAPTAASGMSLSEFLQKHYKKMDDKDKQAVFARLEDEAKKKYDVDVEINDPAPMEGVEFAYCLNLSKCNGSRKCVEACVEENNQSRDPEIQYIKVLEMQKGSLDVEKSNLYYDDEEVPQPDKFYMPVACHHCDNAPCTRVCPVEATWQEKDGIVVIDYDWCIGCRYCQAACPYEARHFNWKEPGLKKEDINPNQGYLSNRLRQKGVMEKCHFCLHRTRKGEYPACLEACPTGARKFGNMLDPNSEVRKIIETKRVYVLKEDLGTIPRFYYFFD